MAHTPSAAYSPAVVVCGEPVNGVHLLKFRPDDVDMAVLQLATGDALKLST